MIDQPQPKAFNFLRPALDQLVAYSSQSEELETSVDKLDANESAYDLPAELKEKLAWQYQEIISSNRYPDGSHGELKSAIAQYVQESCEAITPANISVGNGSDEIIRSLFIATCVGTNASMLTADPTFSMYKIIAQTLGVTPISVPREETHFTIKRGQADQAIAQAEASGHPVKMLFVVHPNSPTGNPLSNAEIDWLKQLPEEILIVIDEAYFEFNGHSLVNELPNYPNWIILRTFSKAFRLAAHRVGYCIAHPEVIAALEKVRLPYNLPTFSQAAAIVALQNRQQLLAKVSEVQNERDKLYNALNAEPRLKVWESASNFLYLRLRGESLEEINQKQAELVNALKEKGTLLRHTANGIRLTVGTPAENERTQKNLLSYLDH
ncbi:histidinol-phosphate transaminase [Euhalothece natronophila Z-M001]|uniref:Histidinol-phosphate aminotransferase n=1 Tax=Euhalothece natronophila Z-M001 TaxID=522448 RepID=A0A5B8NQU5_9CHRO|nr:histidinol-phosphate transaminase [Euhalothece natronophila]QDZ41406.1 histidinol-phosphate transaminase [Euhalothece natronophila Z-M001]